MDSLWQKTFQMPEFEALPSDIQTDVLIIGGTSLAVYPAAGFISYFDGSDLILINRDPTPQDRNASVIIRDPIAQVMAALD